MADLDRPAFVIGTGRCGLSPLMDLVAYHPELAWPSQLNDRFPGQLWLSRLSRIAGWPGLDGALKFRLGRLVPRHAEAFRLWASLFAGFGRPVRDLAAEDVTPWTRDRFRHAVSEMLRHHGRRRFVAEYSGWSRIDFLREIFPEAQFIHVVRDGRAVAHSLIHVDYWLGWQGVHQWRWGVPEPALQQRLERYDGSFLTLAAIQWKMVVRNLLDRTKALPDRDTLLVRYEDMVRDPADVATGCARFLDLDPGARGFRRHLETVRIFDANTQRARIPSWRDNLSAAQVRMLDDLLAEELEIFGYQ